MSDDAYKGFLEEASCLIIESSKAFSTIIQSSLLELGVLQNNINFATNFRQAEKAIEENSPVLIVSEYEINQTFGLYLSEMQHELLEDPYQRIFFVVSGNSSQVAVAEAAEEDVDGYVLKPFSQGDLTKRLKLAIHEKINPTPYIKKIREGKEHLFFEEFEEAEKDFLKAAEMDSEPSLAWYYAGYISEKHKNEPEESLERYRSGLKFKPLHYKCLVGAFDSLFKLKKYDEAYEIVGTLTDYFPITPRRLGHIFITAVYTYQFKDILKYFEIFKNYDHRPDELIRIMTAATMTGGKYSVIKGQYDQAADFFRMGVTISGHDTDYIEKAIKTFLEAEQVKLAERFYGLMDKSIIGSARHKCLGFEIDRQILPPEKIVEKGRELIEEKKANEMVFRTVVQKLIDLDMVRATESAIAKAGESFPDLKAELYEMVDKASDDAS